MSVNSAPTKQVAGTDISVGWSGGRGRTAARPSSARVMSLGLSLLGQGVQMTEASARSIVPADQPCRDIPLAIRNNAHRHRFRRRDLGLLGIVGEGNEGIA